jgi:hypothetical protein
MKATATLTKMRRPLQPFLRQDLDTHLTSVRIRPDEKSRYLQRTPIPIPIAHPLDALIKCYAPIDPTIRPYRSRDIFPPTKRHAGTRTNTTRTSAWKAEALQQHPHNPYTDPPHHLSLRHKSRRLSKHISTMTVDRPCRHAQVTDLFPLPKTTYDGDHRLCTL